MTEGVRDIAQKSEVHVLYGGILGFIPCALSGMTPENQRCSPTFLSQMAEIL